MAASPYSKALAWPMVPPTISLEDMPTTMSFTGRKLRSSFSASSRASAAACSKIGSVVKFVRLSSMKSPQSPFSATHSSRSLDS